MGDQISKTIDRLSNFLADRKGLLPMIGLVLVLANFIIVVAQPLSWVADTNFLLHIGLVITILGILIAPIL